MELCDRVSAERMRALIQQGLSSPASFRSALLEVAPSERDTWLNVVLGLEELAQDGRALPRGCVPYLPSAVDVLLRVVAEAPVGAADVFVDVGSGTGRALSLVHLLTGASAVGIEIQPELVRAARELALRLCLSGVATLQGDASEAAPAGSVYLLYCPFSGERLSRLLRLLEPIAATRSLCVCALDVPLPPTAWLVPDPPRRADLRIWRSSARVSCRPRP